MTAEIVGGDETPQEEGMEERGGPGVEDGRTPAVTERMCEED